MSLKQRKYREKEGLYLIEGLNLFEEALRDPEAIEELFIMDSFYTNVGGKYDLEKSLDSLKEKKIKMALVEGGLFTKLVDTKSPQGIAGIMKIKESSQEVFFSKAVHKGGGKFLVLDRIQDPGNCGSLIRTAEAAGFDGIIAVKGTVDPYSTKVVRSAAGSILRFPILFTGGPCETVKILNKYGLKIVASSPEGSNFYYQFALRDKLAIVIGNEGRGIDNAFIEGADYLVKIPMAKSVESLNAAVAGGILMYEAIRQDFCKKTEEEK